VQALDTFNSYLQDRHVDVVLNFRLDPTFNQMFEGIGTEGMISGVLPLRKVLVFILIFGRHTWPPWEKTEAFHQLIQARIARDGKNSFKVHVDSIGLHSGFPMSDVGVIGLGRLWIRIRPTLDVDHSGPLAGSTLIDVEVGGPGPHPCIRIGALA
jgi:hypothetical protein